MSRVTRRQFIRDTSVLSAGLAVSAVARAHARALEIVWIDWPENQVSPLMSEFEKRHARIKLAVERIPVDQIAHTLEARLNRRTSEPDIFIYEGPYTASYASRGHLAELDSIIDKSRFISSSIDAASYRGKMYSAPFGSSMQVLFYNRALFQKAGVAPPLPDPRSRWTWEQVYDAGGKIAKREANIWGFAFEQSDSPYQLLPLGQSLGGKALSDDGFKASGFIDSPAFIEAYTFMQKLYMDKIAPIGQSGQNAVAELFGSGLSGMLLANTFTYYALRKYVNLDFGVAPHPYFAKGTPVTPMGAWHIGVNPRSHRMEAAAQFIVDMMSDDLQMLWFTLKPYPPAVEEVWRKIGIYMFQRKGVVRVLVAPRQRATTFSPDMWSIVRYELERTAVPQPVTPGFREYEDTLRVALRDIQMGANVKGALRAAAQKIDRELAKYDT